MLFSNWLHQRLDKVIGRLNTKDGQHRPFGLNPQCFLICVRVTDVGKPVGEFKSDGVVSGISEFVVSSGRNTVQLAKNRSKGIISLRCLSNINKRSVTSDLKTLTKWPRCSESTLWIE